MNKQKLSKILVVDDEPAILDLLSKVFDREGYTIDTAESGEAGIKKINAKDYQLILTDIKMEGLSGNDVFLRAKHIKRDSVPLVIGMSGTPWLLDDHNFDAVLPKPFSIKDLFYAINQLLPGEKFRDYATSPS